MPSFGLGVFPQSLAAAVSLAGVSVTYPFREIKTMNRILVGLFLVLAAVHPASGQLLGSGSSLTVPIALPGVAGDLTVSFEGVTGLSLPNLGVSAQLVSPTDAGLLARLPAEASITSGFPVLVRIEPAPGGGFAFTGVARIQLHYLGIPGAAPPRLYAAPLGGPFADITTDVRRATDLKLDTSYRVLGTKGGFSEFLIVADATPRDQAVADKLDRLDQILAENAGAIPGAMRSDLAADLAAARAHAVAGNAEAAIADLDLFLDEVEQHSGTDIPDVWRAARDRVNVAGLLRAGAETLRFSLRQEP